MAVFTVLSPDEVAAFVRARYRSNPRLMSGIVPGHRMPERDRAAAWRDTDSTSSLLPYHQCNSLPNSASV